MSLPWLKGVICLFHKSGKTLMMDYRDYPHKIHAGKYSPGGGKLDASLGDKDSYDAGVRESWEEERIVAHKLIYHGQVRFNNERRTVNGKPMKINMVVDIYDCYDFDDSKAEATEVKDGKKAKLEWIADEDILRLKDFHEGDRRMFEWLQRYPMFEGVIVQEGERLLESDTIILGYSPNRLVPDVL
jgi:8-oxo-dGTP pyrophosphatase MutT (NUDIX family)